MTRENVRTLKRAVRAGSDRRATPTQQQLSRDCALALLARSISFGHGRLAVIRLVDAVDAGAHVPVEHWTYCSEVADTAGDTRLREIFASASAHGLANA